VIPGPFSYHRPTSLAQATSLLANTAPEARVLAGGQSLIPMMKLRLAAPECLIDLGAIPELKVIQRTVNSIVIGAMTTQHEVVESTLVAEAVPILREAALVVADPQVRYLGTLGGNAANGDPGNDMPAVLMCLNASYRLVAHSGVRTVRARDFYLGTYATALQPGEILSAIEIPLPVAGHGYAYEKLKRKIGDYATAAAAVVLTVRGGKVATSSIALTNLADKPLLAEDAAAAVVGTALDSKALNAAANAARAIMAPASDTRGPAEYRTYVGGVIGARALKRAFERARG
jgi:carbon-monoxide dehydrogenase medium subunit